MLKKFNESQHSHPLFSPGAEIFLVTKNGDILEGFYITEILMELVSLNCSPLDGSEKQGFTIEGNLLKPNWCAGKRKFEAACASKEHAQSLALELKKELENPERKRIVIPCQSSLAKREQTSPHN